MNPLHEQFIAEARELIQQASDDLLALDRDGPNSERIDRVFRAFHTLKGSAGIVELPAMSLMLHAAEDVLAAMHAGRIDADANFIDRALACLDQVARWVDDFESRGALPAHAADDGRAMAERLRALLPADAVTPDTAPAGRSAGSDRDSALSAWALQLMLPVIEPRGADISRALHEPAAALWAISYEPDAGCFFNGDDPLQLMRQVPGLLALQVEPREPWPALAELDPFACNLRLRALCVADRAELARIFRLVPDQVRILAVPTAAVRAHRKEPPADRDMINLVRSVLEEQSRVMRISSSSDDFVGRVGAAARAAAHALRHAMRIDAAESVERAGAATLARNDVTSLISALEQALAVLGELPAPDGELGPAPEAAVAPLADGERQVVRSLRVHEAKIDGLVNLAGELLVAKNALAHLAKMIESELPGHALAGAAKREHEAIERLAGEMHAAVLQLRMVPVAQVLRAFPRLVRDLSHRLDKKVELVTRGETTEADKTIVDRLHEPLLHLVRNALDHGIESPAQRRASDKRDTATITIEAARLGDRFVVDVIDDGCGIDPAIVRRTAQERRLMAENELALLSDEQVLDLIFAAGFSTAAAVSDISGRGVGMDAVRATIEQLGGRVSVISRVGAGTTVRLDLPMSIAMSRIMVVQAGGQLFGIPMDAVTETVRLRPDRISQIKSNDGFVLRDRVMPICSLAELMKLPRTATSAADERLLVVAEAAGRIAALEVAAIRDRLDIVLKPMQGLLAGVRGFAGTTVLGDGSVLLVLDLKEILP